MADWGSMADSLNGIEVVLAAEVLYDPAESSPLAHCVAKLLSGGGTLLLADPTRGRAAGCRAALIEALRELGARVSEAPLGALALLGEAIPTEEMVLVRADFAK
mmetsp:Transcript_51966/g.103422  ORF Transcript_51966/g.103422 Transcript_51966/m.103422 type:complete len:104 (-) Transcript_51966:65-376(-)